MKNLMTTYKYKGTYLSLTLALIVLFFSLKPPSEENLDILISDNFLHLIAYILVVLPVLLERVYSQLMVFIVALAFGGFIELIQPFFGREADIMDFFSNAVGILFGIIIAQGCLLVFKINSEHKR